MFENSKKTKLAIFCMAAPSFFEVRIGILPYLLSALLLLIAASYYLLKNKKHQTDDAIYNMKKAVTLMFTLLIGAFLSSIIPQQIAYKGDLLFDSLNTIILTAPLVVFIAASRRDAYKAKWKYIALAVFLVISTIVLAANQVYSETYNRVNGIVEIRPLC